MKKVITAFNINYQMYPIDTTRGFLYKGIVVFNEKDLPMEEALRRIREKVETEKDDKVIFYHVERVIAVKFE